MAFDYVFFFFLTLKAEYRRYADVEMVSGEVLQAEAALFQVIVKIGGVQTAASEEIIGQGQPRGLAVALNSYRNCSSQGCDL